MAVISPAIGIQDGSHSAQAFRQLVSALAGQDVETFAGGVSASGPAHGVVRSTHLKVSEKSGTADMSVDVAAGLALITGSSSLAQGAYAFANDATVNLSFAVSDATNARYDLIVAQVRDNDEDAGGQDDARLAVITGTPSAAPTDPSVPAGCLVLARVAVAANATSIVNADITDLRPRCNRPGSPWQAYTPSLSNITLGNGVLDFRWCWVGPTTVRVRGEFTLGSTSSVSGLMGFGYPAGLASRTPPRALGTCWLIDANGADMVGACQAGGAINLYSDVIGATTSTNPFTWADGDQVVVDVSFEVS